jgi:hypothetical protein
MAADIIAISPTEFLAKSIYTAVNGRKQVWHYEWSNNYLFAEK